MAGAPDPARRHRRIDDSGERILGAGSPTVPVTVHDQRAFWAFLYSGSVGLGSSYVNGWWDCDDLTVLVQLLARNVDGVGRRLDRWARGRGAGIGPIAPADGHRQTAIGPTSGPITTSETNSSSRCSMRPCPTRVRSLQIPRSRWPRRRRPSSSGFCRKLALGPSDHVWRLARAGGASPCTPQRGFGARVTTTTISDAQYEYTAKRVADAGLGDRVTVVNQDYRDLGGVYDKLVSIEMIEAVGWRQLDTFFLTCARLLRPEGLMALQSIVIEDGSYERAKDHDDLVKRLVFPGGFLPSIEAIARSVASGTELRIVDLEDMGRHYAETLRRWRTNVEAHAEQIDALGLGEAFSRLWHIYLCYCEAAFLERHVSDVQVILARPAWRASLGPGEFSLLGSASSQCERAPAAAASTAATAAAAS